MAFMPSLRRALAGGSGQEQKVVQTALTDYYAGLVAHYGGLTRDWPIERAVAEGFDRVIWVFKSVQTISSDSARLPFRLREGEGADAQIVDDHPLYRVLNKKANPLETGQIFRKRLSAQVLLSKRGAFVEVTKSNRGTVRQLDLLPPDRVKIIPGSGKDPVKCFELTLRTGGVRNLDPEQVRWIRDPHPIDPYSGVTPLESMGMSVELDHFARLYNVSFMRNDGRPGGILAVRGSGEAGQVKDVDPKKMNRLEERFGRGPVEAGKLSVIQGELDYVDLAARPRDMQYGETSRNAKIEILSGFGVGESVLGYAAERTFDNADNELYVYWTRTMPAHNEILLTGFDEDSEDAFTGFLDTSSVEVLERAERTKRAEAREEVAAGLRSIWNYAQVAKIEDIESTPHTRALYIASGKTPLPSIEADAAALGMAQPEEPPALPPGGEAPPGLPGGETPGAPALPPGPRPPGATGDEAPAAPRGPGGAARAALDAVAGRKGHPQLRAIEGGRPKVASGTETSQRKAAEAERVSELDVEAVERLEESLAHVFAALVERWMDRAEARLVSPKQRKGTRHWQPEYAADTRVGTKALDTAKAVDEDTWQREAEEQAAPIVSSAAIAAAVALMADFGVTAPPGTTLAQMAAQSVTYGVDQIVGMIGQAASGQAARVIREVNSADQAGEDWDGILAALRKHTDRLGGWAKMLGSYAAFGALNGARDDAAREANRDEFMEVVRAWFSRRDDRVRPSHRLADGQVRALDEPFIVGDSLLRFPCDPLAPLSETANCRCWLRYRSRRSGQWVATPDGKALALRDGDGDGFIEDGTPRMRPAVRAVRPPLPHEEAVAAGAARIARHRVAARAYTGPPLTRIDDYGDMERAVRQMFDAELVTATGRRVGTEDVKVEGFYDQGGRGERVVGFTVDGNLVDLDGGAVVGSFTRTVFVEDDNNNVPWVYHDGLTIEREAQGEGIASEFNAHAIAWYRQHGVHFIRTHAAGTRYQVDQPVGMQRPTGLSEGAQAISEAVARSLKRAHNGGYTWGQQGFTFTARSDEPGQTSFAETLFGKLWRAADANPRLLGLIRRYDTLDPAEQDAVYGELLMLRGLPLSWWQDPVQRAILADLIAGLDPATITPYELNAAGRGEPFIDHDTGEETWLGKALMSRSSWAGEFNLSWLNIYPETKGMVLDDAKRRMLADLFLASLGDQADTMETKGRTPAGFARLARDGDGDGWIFDGTPRQRPARRWSDAVDAERSRRQAPKPDRTPATDATWERPESAPMFDLTATMDAMKVASRDNAERIINAGGNPGILDRLVVLAEAYDRAVYLGVRVAEALERLLEVMHAIRDLKDRDGTPILDQDELGDGFRGITSLHHLNPAPTKAKPWYSVGVEEEKTVHRGSTVRDGDGDGFVDDGKPNMRPAQPRRLRLSPRDVMAGDLLVERDYDSGEDVESVVLDVRQIKPQTWVIETLRSTARYAVQRRVTVRRSGPPGMGEGPSKPSREPVAPVTVEEPRPAPEVEAPAAPKPTTAWRRAIGGYMHPSGDYFLERQAPMAGGRTNAWAIYQRAPADRVAQDRPGAQAYDPTTGEPLTQIDGGDWYAHVGDEGSLGAAKYAVDRLRGVPEPEAPDARRVARDAAAQRFADADADQRAQALSKVEARLADETIPPVERTAFEGIRDYLTEQAEQDTPDPDEGPKSKADFLATEGRRDGAGTKDDPIDVAGDLDRAATLIADGKHVRLNRVDEVGTLVGKLADLVRDAAERGDAAPTYDLCLVSVPRTNLFCQQSHGIPRVEMPQLSGKPLPGSPADALPRNERGNVNVKGLFRERLISQGVSTEDREVPSEWLKATQSQLDGPTVGRIYRENRAGRFVGSGIVATRDGYLLDGHHQWAAQVALDSDDGVLGDHLIKVEVIDLDIGEALTLARDFAVEQGVRPSGIGAAENTGPPRGLPPDFRADVSYRRDADGERLPEGQGAVIAYDGDTPIGVLRWDYEAETPTVVDMSVDENYRRRGVATAMFERARAAESRLQHSDVLTEEGTAWAAAEQRQARPERHPNFGQRIGAPRKRPGPGGGYVLVEVLQGLREGQTVERVLYRVERRDGVWGAYPPTEQSPAAFQGTKREVDRWAMNHALGRPDPADDDA